MSYPSDSTPPPQPQPPMNPQQWEYSQSYQQPQSGSASSGEGSNTKVLAIITHGLTILTSFVGPLVFWLIYKDKQDPDSQYIAANSRHAFNFSLTMLLAGIALSIVTGILAIITLGLASPLTALAGAPGIVLVVFAIIAMVKVGEGEVYEYPNGITLRLIK